jgi:hypothetical protein
MNRASGRPWLLFLQALLLIVCASLAAVGLANWHGLITHANSLPPGGDHLSAARIRLLITLVRAAALGLFGLLALSLWFRASLEIHVGQVLGEFQSSLQELGRDTRASIFSLSHVALLSLAVVTIAGTILRIRYLFQPMRYDESLSFDQFASQPLSFFLRDYSIPNNHIFHNILVHFTTSLFGDQPWAIRLPALVAGILLIPVSAFVFKHFFGTLVGLLVAALVAGNSILMEYSINSRGYSILTLIFLVLIALADYLKRRTNLAGWLLFILLAALGFYTIPTMLYPFGMLIGWLLLAAIFERNGIASKRLILHSLIAAGAVIALTFIFYSPVILYHGIKPLIGNSYVAPLTGGQFLHGWPTSLKKLWIQWNRGLPTLIGMLLSGGVLLYFVVRHRIDRQRFSLLLASLSWCVLAVLMQRVIPFERVWIFLVPIYLALAAAGFVAIAGPLAAARGDRSGPLLLGAPAIVLIYASLFVVSSRSVAKSGEAFPDVLQTTRYFESELKPGDHVIASCPNDGILLYYARHNAKLEHSLHDDAKHPYSRLLIVVRNSDQTIDGILKDNRVAASEFENAERIKEFPSATIYAARRYSSVTAVPKALESR